MATYEEAGVNIEKGDECSRIAYKAAKATFPARKGMIGEPVVLEDGFAGAMDFGDFYLIQNDDGIGTKMIVAQQAEKYDTMGYDLLAMVCDDAICVGAEVVSMSNTIDVQTVDSNIVDKLMEGLSKACIEQKIIIPGGEIAELGPMVNGYVWNATSIGIVEKDKFITGSKVEVGDKIVGLGSGVFRSNGMSLVRHILTEKFGEQWNKEDFGNGQTWGDIVLTPTIIYHNCVLEMIGRYKEAAKADVHAIAHITGGGLPGNVSRVLKGKGYGAKLSNLPAPHEAVSRVIEYGNVDKAEAYKTWNMGVGMVLISNEFEKIQAIAQKHGIKAYEIGEVTAEPGISIDGEKF